MTPVIIEAALSGYASAASNPHNPTTPEQVAADALACLAEGAAIIHTHIDDVKLTGERAAERYLRAWHPILEQRPDTILYSTTTSASGIQEKCAHYAPLARAGMRMGVLDPGSTNLGPHDAQDMPVEPGFVYANSFADIAYTVEQLRALDLGPSIAIYEPGWLRTVIAYWRAGRLPRGAFVKLYFSDHNLFTGKKSALTFGLPPTRRALEAYLELLEGTDLPWAVAVFGGDLVGSGMARLGLGRGGHVRVGLEDYRGERTPSNRELVTEVAALAYEMGRPVADCVTTSRLLQLPSA
ncbi:MAG: 3-keto-5-aminohexanoate cleavage protein [Steroidobacteraceae bacterium]